MSCRILTKGHIKALEYLTQFDFVMVGLLTKKAMKGYKDELVPYKDRLYILETIARSIEDISIVPQDSLDPTKNIRKYKCNSIASGDGWTKEELKAIKKLKIKRIDFDSGEKLHSSNVLDG